MISPPWPGLGGNWTHVLIPQGDDTETALDCLDNVLLLDWQPVQNAAP